MPFHLYFMPFRAILQVLQVQMKAKEEGFSDVLFLDVTNKYIEEVSSCNIFAVKVGIQSAIERVLGAPSFGLLSPLSAATASLAQSYGKSNER